jgi:hypothetical protein
MNSTNNQTNSKKTLKHSTTGHRRGSIATLFKPSNKTKLEDKEPLTQVDDSELKAQAKLERKNRRKSVYGRPTQAIFNERLFVSGAGRFM